MQPIVVHAIGASLRVGALPPSYLQPKSALTAEDAEDAEEKQEEEIGENVARLGYRDRNLGDRRHCPRTEPRGRKILHLRFSSASSAS